MSQVKSFTYDAAGRTTAITEGAVTTNFSYDYEDRITQITRSGMTTNSFGYSGVGTRVAKTDSGGSLSYMRNGTGVTSPVLSDGSANYTPGISERRSGTTKHLSADIKNTTQQLDAAQTICASKQYDAFGNITSQTGTWNGPFSYGGKFGYQSDSDTNLQLLGHRYYDSAAGRFLTRDTSKAGRNWMTYCMNEPVTYADPNGRAPIPAPVEGSNPSCAGEDERDWWQRLKDGAFDFAVGWGDGVSCGLTGIIREAVSPGCSFTVDEDSWAYKGGRVDGIVNAIPLEGAAIGRAANIRWIRWAGGGGRTSAKLVARGREIIRFEFGAFPKSAGRKLWHFHWMDGDAHLPWDWLLSALFIPFVAGANRQPRGYERFVQPLT